MSDKKRRPNINPANLNIDDRISEVLDANLDQVIDFANTHGYTHINDINNIPVNRQFYEVNINNNLISTPKIKVYDTIKELSSATVDPDSKLFIPNKYTTLKHIPDNKLFYEVNNNDNMVIYAKSKSGDKIIIDKTIQYLSSEIVDQDAQLFIPDKYTKLDDIPKNTLFYEVKKNNDKIGYPKIKIGNEIKSFSNKIGSNTSHFIITDDTLISHSIVNWASDRVLKQRGGKRTRMRKSSKKRRTTKRRTR